MACDKCDNGYIINAYGIRVKCNCIINGTVKESEVKAEKPMYHVTGAQKEMAVYRKLIPEARQNDEFEEQFVRDRVIEMCEAQNCKVKDFQKYVDTLNDIIVAISVSVLRKSYIIGSPNGFGKTTFANTCIKRLDAMGKKASPYISLFELAELRAEYEKKMLGYIKKEVKEAEAEGTLSDIDYTWTDYMKSDVLFTYLTTLENKKLEVKLLKTIVDIRGPKGLPTIVFTSSSLKPYLQDADLKRFVWDDILAYNDESAGCDRLMHRSCFKLYNNALPAIAGEDY